MLLCFPRVSGVSKAILDGAGFRVELECAQIGMYTIVLSFTLTLIGRVTPESVLSESQSHI